MRLKRRDINLIVESIENLVKTKAGHSAFSSLWSTVLLMVLCMCYSSEEKGILVIEARRYLQLCSGGEWSPCRNVLLLSERVLTSLLHSTKGVSRRTIAVLLLP